MFKDRRFVKRSIIWGKSNSQYVEKNNFVCYTSEIINTHMYHLFLDYTISIYFSLCPHKYKWILCTEKPVLAIFVSSDVQE